MTRQTFFCIDAHTCGNPVRIVVGGGPLLPNVPMAEKREIFLRDYDWVRRALMFEPRGHDGMSGAILYPSSRDDCDVGILFIEVSGCLPMCGHGTIGTVTAAIEEGLVVPRHEGKLSLEAPAGKIEVEYVRSCEYVEHVRLFNVASYLHAQDVDLDVPGLGSIKIDLSYGGNYYAIVEPQVNWPGLDGMSATDILRLSPLVRTAAEAKLAPVHPENSRIRGVSHVMWTDKPRLEGAHARNAVFYGDKAIDRSPCGTGSSARMAQLVARGRMNIGDTFVHESIIGTTFDCRVEEETQVGGKKAIKPSVAGWARVIGHNTIFVSNCDPLAHGFQIT
ncbi:4-hydroxyproline epimerase [Rhizobium mesoamericanum]|uniref:4-hydroxyproline epimerase n=1 Tax=Rhizobium mesoamericanum STM3625 TaxID=1211777 RepID=K0Q6H0_9HYPH|nr:4-hydroxyproline epimerase [Rhizobium mesoamericanum]CCM79844.1 4-hydroxyproline epimerase [Rhizobium mesoamericanum STM3625]